MVFWFKKRHFSFISVREQLFSFNGTAAALRRMPSSRKFSPVFFFAIQRHNAAAAELYRFPHNAGSPLVADGTSGPVRYRRDAHRPACQPACCCRLLMSFQGALSKPSPVPQPCRAVALFETTTRPAIRFVNATRKIVTSWACHFMAIPTHRKYAGADPIWLKSLSRVRYYYFGFKLNTGDGTTGARLTARFEPIFHIWTNSSHRIPAGPIPVSLVFNYFLTGLICQYQESDFFYFKLYLNKIT